MLERCLKCFEKPCECGYAYEELSIEEIQTMISLLNLILIKKIIKENKE